MPKTLRQQLDDLKQTLRTTKFPADSPILTQVKDGVANFQGTISEFERAEIAKLIRECFSLTPEQSALLEKDLTPDWEPTKVKTSFDLLIPPGWLRDYIDGTYESESPTVYHFFCAATILGAMTDRRIWVSKGHYRVFPNLNVILIGPAGKVKKTSAINIALDIVMRAGYEKIVLGQSTPESFIVSLGGNDPASCLVVGREMAAFFHKAKYMDGIIPLFTDLSDCPPIWASQTVARGKLKIRNVMLSAMYGTTMDWLIHNMPADIYGGGFMRRHIQVPQERTDRIVSRPLDMDPHKIKLAETLKILTYYQGEVTFSGDSGSWYDDWYKHHKKDADHVEEEKLAGYMESKPDFVLRLAMLIQVSQNLHHLTIESLHQAIDILEWLEQFLPSTFASMATTALGEQEDRVLKIIRRNGGRLAHSDLVRRMSKHVTADQLRAILRTLMEAEMLEEHAKTGTEARSYYLTKKSAGVVG